MSLRFAAVSLAATAACTDPVVEMELHMPTNVDMFDTSCVSAVSVVVAGANIAQDFNDYTWSCQEISPQNRLSGIHGAIRGKFDINVPSSGVAGVEIFGFSGPTPCSPPEFVSPDLIFHGSSAYIGQDTLDIKLETTLDCSKQQVKLRPVELIGLVSGPTPSSDNCATSAVVNEAWASLGQIMDRPFSSGVDFWGGFRGADIANGLASFSAATTGLTKSCLAFDSYGEIGFATGCAIPGGKVCAGADEIDVPVIERDIANEALTLDEALLTKWDSMSFVSVWDNGSPRRPIAGAKVNIGATEGAVLYVDPPAAGGTQLIKRTDGQTGTSGLAVVFTNRLAKVTVTANGASRDVTIASPDWSAGAAMVVMP